MASLQQVCLKAGLPTDAWLWDETTLATFEGYAIRGRLAETLAPPADGRPRIAAPSPLARQPSVWPASQGLPWSNYQVIVGCSPAAVAQTSRPSLAGRPPAPQPADPEDRSAAVAGAFYPGKLAEVDQMLDEFLVGQPAEPPQAWAAAMIPHAGWIYSGRLAAAVLSRVNIPSRSSSFAPRHPPMGRVGPSRRIAAG